jgi:integrase/recombinase XerD
MFEILFQSQRARSRHTNGPLAKERKAFLAHLASQGLARETLLEYARELLLVAAVVERRGLGRIERSEIDHYARESSKCRQQSGPIGNLKWPVRRFVKVARAWCFFTGWLKSPEAKPFSLPVARRWAKLLRSEARLSEWTVYAYCSRVAEFLQWLQLQGGSLPQVTIANVDAFMKHLGARGLARVTLCGVAVALRRFFRDSYTKGWCQRDLAPAILFPPIFRHENVPTGPSWPEVKRLIAATEGTSNRDVRNRAILLLLAVYGLRCGEVTAICLQDLDWTRRILRLRRSKTDRLQEYPLTGATAKAIRQYLKNGRPLSARPELFLTLLPPFRPLSNGAVYEVTSTLFTQLNIVSRRRGPHSLRHACATYLLGSSFPLKAIGDHLGHVDLTTTQIYAKVDMAGLRRVAAFDLGGLL